MQPGFKIHAKIAIRENKMYFAKNLHSMKKLILLSALTLTCSFAVKAQNSAEEKAWMAFMTPGEQHNTMAAENGIWDEEITFYMAPGAPPTTAKSVCTNEMILGGRYQRSVHKGEMMGMPFEGEGITGYDNGRKIFFSTWIDNMGTGIMYSEGKYDPVKKQLEFKGKSTDPASGAAKAFRQTMKNIDADHQVMEMYMVNKGKEFKSMEIRFTRRK